MSAIASLLFAVPAWPDELSPSRSTSVSENAAPFPVDPAAQDSADAQRSWADRFQRALDDERYKVSLDTRARIGLADFEGNRKAYAYTVRSRFGVGSKPWKGLSAFIEGEGTYTPAHSKYFDGTGDNKNNRSTVADVRALHLNRAFVRYQNPELLGADLIGGASASSSTTHASSATSAGARTSRPSTRLASPPTSGSTGLRPPTLTSGTSTASHQTRGRKRRGTGTHVHTS